jgi:hypothetical protein
MINYDGYVRVKVGHRDWDNPNCFYDVGDEFWGHMEITPGCVYVEDQEGHCWYFNSDKVDVFDEDGNQLTIV